MAETRAFGSPEVINVFKANLAEGAHILDLGCGSGRDSRHFIDQGYTVTAVDGSAEIAACAEQLIGQPVKVTTSDFDDLISEAKKQARLSGLRKSDIKEVIPPFSS